MVFQTDRIFHVLRSKRTKNLCLKHHISSVEQPNEYEKISMNAFESFLKVISEFPNLLDKPSIELIKAMPWELSPTAWHDPLERKKKRELIEKTNFQKEMNSDERCPNCKVVGKSYCFDLKQMRSADEPMTQLWKCDNCRYRWNL